MRTAFWITSIVAVLTLASMPAAQEKAVQKKIHSQPSYVLATKEVELAVTRLGGQMAPVTFYRNTDRPVQPYYISPWQDEPPQKMPAPVLVPLRGDFFCMPF